jgi:chromate transporter
VAGAALGAGLAGLNEIVVLVLGGLVALAASRGGGGLGGRALAGLGFLGVAGSGSGGVAGAALASAASTAIPYTLAGLGWFFLKVGSVLFGSGYVLLAFLEADLVTRWGWLTRQQLLEAVAIGQFTPGPLFTTATFIGHLLGGFSGGAVATGAIFLPAFVFVALSGPLIPRLRRSARAAAFLDGVIAASLALMVGVTLELARAAVVDLATLALAAGAAVGLLRFRIQATWLVLAGAAAGLGLHWR